EASRGTRRSTFRRAPDTTMKTDAALTERATLPLLDVAHLRKETELLLDWARRDVAAMEQIPIGEVGADLLDRWDRRSMRIEDLLGPAALFASVHPAKDVRDAADATVLELSSFSIEIFQNPLLYERVRAVEPRSPAEDKLRRDLLEAFEDHGVTLPEDRRRRLKEISDLLVELDQEFERNIRENNTQIRFRPEEYRGVPEAWLDQVQREPDGSILIGFDPPEYNTFMSYAADGGARKRYYIEFMRRGSRRNLEILQEIADLRRETASLYALPSYAHYVVRRRMAEQPEQVTRFLGQVRGVVQEVERNDLEALKHLKSELEEIPVETTDLHVWDVPYFRERLRERDFGIDQEELRRYFPTQTAVEWVLEIATRLYGIHVERTGVAAWHPDVQHYDVFDGATGELLGGIYLDLYPRDGKYKHAAAWPARGVSRRAARTPISVLVTNFERRGLTHTELETLLHEMGHVLHGVLSHTEFNEHSGTSVERDFVEAPSQMFEEWGRRMESLSLIAEISPGCPPVDEELVRRLDASRRFGRGIHYARQHLYASYDMALAGEEHHDPLDLWRSLEGATTLGHHPDTEFPGTFGHITGGYAAGYYGYMWSEVIAIDMLSAFEGDLMDPDVGRRFRETILARGSEAQARQMVERFLGRPVDPRAFFAELRGGR
ncbi:MAG TPA: M3 family metallopeptidase, partial [Thermoanaerobaculia bacterium]|nr:M3 family metallopeptidase [Thermoanaerobaculia bacterium]